MAGLPAASRGQIFRFLLVGGFAAAVNWLLRFPLSLVMPLPAAVVVAYAVGMGVGFTLYRRHVFPGSDRPIAQQTLIFIAVNLLGAVIVLAVTLALLALQQSFGYPLWIKEGAAHGLAIGVGAVINFIGHKTLTFSLGPSRRAAPLADHGDRR